MQTLLILHGWGGSKKTWKDFLDFAQKNDDLFIDLLELPCFGEQPCPQEAWGVEEYAEFVYKYIQKKEYQPKHLTILGHSFGGQIASALLSKHKQLCEKLILSGPAIHRPKNLIKRGIFAIISRGGKLIFSLPGIRLFHKKAQKILYRGADSPDYAYTQGIQRKIFKKVIRQDQLKKLSQIKQKTLLLWGKSDRYVPYSHIKKIAKKLPHSNLVIMEGTHGLHHNQTKEQFYKEIHSFIFS